MRPERVRVRRWGRVSVGSFSICSFMSRSCPSGGGAAIGACPDPSLRDPRSPFGHIHDAGPPYEAPTLSRGRGRGRAERGGDPQPRPVERPGRAQPVDQPVTRGRRAVRQHAVALDHDHAARVVQAGSQSPRQVGDRERTGLVQGHAGERVRVDERRALLARRAPQQLAQRRGVIGVVEDQEVSPADRREPLRAAVRSAQPLEPAVAHALAPQDVAVAPERHRELHADAQPQREHEHAAVGELVAPGDRDVGGADRELDPVIRRVVRRARPAVADAYLDVVHAGQPLLGLAREVFVDVDGDDAVGEPAEQRGVVAGAGADLEHGVAGLQAELFEHDRDYRGLAGRADRHTGVVPFGDQDGVGVRLVAAVVRNEVLARHRGHRVGHPLIGEHALVDQQPDQSAGGAWSQRTLCFDPPGRCWMALLRIDAQFTDEERLVRDTARRFAAERIEPHVADWFEAGAFPARELAPELGSLGFLGMHLSGYGCPGAGAVAYGIACRELEAADSGLRSFVSVQGSLAMSAIHKYGSEEQKQEWLPRMAAGEALGCFGLTEPDHGSDPANMRTHAKREGSDWVLNGSKMWITNGSVADVAVVWARTDEGGRGFLVPPGTPGFSTRDIHKKLSLRASITSELVLDDVRLPSSAMLPEVRGLKGPLGCLSEARYGIIWGAVGAGRACYEAAVEYSRSREQFGKPIAGFQLTQEKLAWMEVALGQAGLVALRIGRLKEAGEVTPQQVSFGKLANVRAALDVARSARSVLGANGVTLEYPVIRHMTNLESVLTYEGTQEIHTLVLGEAITGISAYR